MLSILPTVQPTCCVSMLESATPSITSSISSVAGITALRLTSYAGALETPVAVNTAVYVTLSPASTAVLGRNVRELIS